MFLRMSKTRLPLRLKFAIFVGGVVAISITGIFYWMYYQSKIAIMDAIDREARILLKQVLITREWVADHSGVYLRKGPDAETNPFLPGSDIKDTEGRPYVLRNPAMVTRELSEYANKAGLYRFHITSLKFRNPANSPTPFEKKVLLEFERSGFDKSKEGTAEITEENGTPVYRRIIPLRVERPCLRCHQADGYKEGDIRGGLTVTIPIAEANQAIQKSRIAFSLSGAGIVLFILGILYLVVQSLVLKPVEHLHHVAERIQHGKYDERAFLNTGDELQDMARAFNEMIDRLMKANETLQAEIAMRKEMEKKLREYSETLEQKVKERTKELEDANLELQVLNRELELRRAEAEEAKLRADTASRAKSDFLANMSHELRTPLNAIIGFSEVLQDELFGKLNETQKEYVGDILNSGRHLLALINDILDLSKVESGRMELELSRFSLKDTLNASTIMLKEKAMKHGIKLSLELEPEADIEIEADERKLKQIVFNLLSNAVKFTPDGGSVRLSAQRVSLRVPILRDEAISKNEIPPPHLMRGRNDNLVDYIEITVEDTGIGIKSEDIPRLFKEFSQLESAYNKKYEGTGLGLALTKKLVELHRGRIWAESEFGKGSKFTFIIPVRQ